MNGFDQDGMIIVDACQFEYAPLFPNASGEMLPDNDPYLTRWGIDLNKESPKVNYQRVNDNRSEFPVLDPRRAMREYRYGYHTSADTDDGEMYNMVVAVDHETGGTQRYSFGDRKQFFTSEAIFVPRADDAAENEGYLLSVVTDMEAGKSSLEILDAQNVSAGPLASAKLNHRIPVGFHGGWRPGA